MMRQTIDEYLDGALDAQEQAAVEQAIARDPAAAELTAAMRTERTVRAAVYASYEPSKADASAFAAQILAACEDEAAVAVGRITPAKNRWVWYGSGIAAAVAIAISAFGLGRMTAPVSGSTTGSQVATSDKGAAVWVVPVKNMEESTPKVFRFTSTDEAEVKVRELQAPPEPVFADAGDIALPGQL